MRVRDQRSHACRWFSLKFIVTGQDRRTQKCIWLGDTSLRCCIWSSFQELGSCPLRTARRCRWRCQTGICLSCGTAPACNNQSCSMKERHRVCAVHMPSCIDGDTVDSERVCQHTCYRTRNSVTLHRSCRMSTRMCACGGILINTCTPKCSNTRAWPHGLLT